MLYRTDFSLLSLSHQVVGKYPAIFGVVAATVALHVAFLLWWATALVTTLKSFTGAAGVLRLGLLLFNLYWTSQALRLFMFLVAVGTTSHWFANAYPLDDEKDLGSGDFGSTSKGSCVQLGMEKDGLLGAAAGAQSLLRQSSPLLSDGSLLPPLPAEGTEDVRGGSVRPELADGGSHQAVLHFARCGLTTSLGSVCRSALMCLPVRWAEAHLRLARALPRLEAALCADAGDEVVRAHHELLLVHVALYAKSAAAAARDVWQLIDESGLEVHLLPPVGITRAHTQS